MRFALCQAARAKTWRVKSLRRKRNKIDLIVGIDLLTARIENQLMDKIQKEEKRGRRAFESIKFLFFFFDQF